MAFVAKCVARWCKVETHRLITLFQGKMVVVITHPIFKFSVPQIMPRNSGTNTTQENNFQAGWLRCCWKINFKKSVQKNFQPKRVLTSLRINLKKSVCLFGNPPSGGVIPPKEGVDAILTCHLRGGPNGWFDPSKVGYTHTPPCRVSP